MTYAYEDWIIEFINANFDDVKNFNYWLVFIL
jgi:hypothetical protein